MIFVRHGRPVVGHDAPEQGWPLDPAYVDDIRALRTALPELPLVCSDMSRAIETAKFFARPTIEGWELQADARARFEAVVNEHGRAIYVTHGTVMTLYLASVEPTLDATRFWTDLRIPDAWELDASGLRRLSAGRD